MRFEIFFLAFSMVSAQQIQQGQPPQDGEPTQHGQPQMQGQGQPMQQFEGHPQQYQPQPGKYFYQN